MAAIEHKRTKRAITCLVGATERWDSMAAIFFEETAKGEGTEHATVDKLSSSSDSGPKTLLQNTKVVRTRKGCISFINKVVGQS